MAHCTGLLTAMVTPFDAQGRVDEEIAVSLGRRLLAGGSDGVVVGATTGEPSTLRRHEKISLFETLVGSLGSEGSVVAHTGSNDTREACWLTERAVDARVHAVMSVTPYYNKPSRRGLIRHYEEVAKAASGLPVILYNNPDRTALNLTPDLLAELAQIDGIEAVKQSNRDELQLIDGLAVLAGNDDLLARNLDIGGAGGVCVASHLVGEEMKRLFDEPERRAEIDSRLRDVYEVLFITSSPAPLKAALSMLGIDVGGVRLPLVEADEADRSEIRRVLERHHLIPAERSRL